MPTTDHDTPRDTSHDHVTPPLPPLDNALFGVPGVTDPTPFAKALAAGLAGCDSCCTRHVHDVAEQPMLTLHALVSSYLVVDMAARIMGIGGPPLAILAAKYDPVTITVWSAMLAGNFSDARDTVEAQNVPTRRAAVDEAITTWVGAWTTIPAIRDAITATAATAATAGQNTEEPTTHVSTVSAPKETC
jgi:hypothetical protein